jgi:hypothetical protein
MFYIKLLLILFLWFFSLYKLLILFLMIPLFNLVYHYSVINNYWLDSDNLYIKIVGNIILYINFCNFYLSKIYKNNKKNIIFNFFDYSIIYLENINNKLLSLFSSIYIMISLFLPVINQSYNPKIIPVNIDNFQLIINLLDKLKEEKLSIELHNNIDNVYYIMTKDLRIHILNKPINKKKNNLINLIKLNNT